MTAERDAPVPGTPDPSMEDILASIRRILNEEEADPVAPAPALPEPAPTATRPIDPAPHPAAQAEPDSADVLELDDTMMVPDTEPHEPAMPTLAPPPEPAMAADPASIPPAPQAPVPSATPALIAPALIAPALIAPALIAPAAAAAAAQSVGELMRTLASERSTQVHRGGPTIEDLVREEIRPLMKDWLDAHLAPLVERLVRAEIERVVSRMT